MWGVTKTTLNMEGMVRERERERERERDDEGDCLILRQGFLFWVVQRAKLLP
jgi:hypothetical protein